MLRCSKMAVIWAIVSSNGALALARIESGEGARAGGRRRGGGGGEGEGARQALSWVHGGVRGPALRLHRIHRGGRPSAVTEDPERGGSRPRLHDFTLSHARETSQAQPSVEAHDAEAVVRVAQFRRGAPAVGHGGPGGP